MNDGLIYEDEFDGYDLELSDDMETITLDSLDTTIEEAIEEEKVYSLEPIDEELFHSTYEKQRSVELVMSSNHTKSRIMSFLMNHTDLVNYMQKHLAEEEEMNFAFEFLYQLILRKRIDILTVVGVMRKKAEDAGSVISKCAFLKSIGLCMYDPVREQFVVKIELPEDIQRDIDRFGYPLPMIVKPRWIRSNRQTGYLTIKGSLLLKNNHHDQDIYLNHLNRVNRIPLTVDVDAYYNTELIWDNMEKPKSIFKMAKYNKKIKAYNKFRRDSSALITMMSQLCNQFYLTHKYDKRGRVYCQGYHFSYQGSDWNKAILKFANEEIVEID